MCRVPPLLLLALGAASAAPLGCLAAISERARESARVHYDMGVTAFERGESRAALRALWVAVRDDPELAEAHHALGLVLHAMNRPDKALAHYRRALALRPDFSAAQNNMGVLLLDRGRLDEAIAAFAAALDNMLYSTPHLAEGNMGWAYYRRGDVAQARAHLEAATASEPRFCRGYTWLTRIALAEHEPAQVIALGRRFARHCLDDALIADSVAPDVRREMTYYVAQGHLARGERDEARALLTECAVDDAEATGFGARCAASLTALN